MAVPKRKHSNARTGSRRANHMKVKKPNLSSCPNCSYVKPQHVVCPNCGWYMGRVVIEAEE